MVEPFNINSIFMLICDSGVTSCPVLIRVKHNFFAAIVFHGENNFCQQ